MPKVELTATKEMYTVTYSNKEIEDLIRKDLVARGFEHRLQEFFYPRVENHTEAYGDCTYYQFEGYRVKFEKN